MQAGMRHLAGMWQGLRPEARAHALSSSSWSSPPPKTSSQLSLRPPPWAQPDEVGVCNQHPLGQVASPGAGSFGAGDAARCWGRGRHATASSRLVRLRGAPPSRSNEHCATGVCFSVANLPWQRQEPTAHRHHPSESRSLAPGPCRLPGRGAPWPAAPASLVSTATVR